ncbi:MAG: zf-HC2 domain-containing protein [Bacillus sp. (in: Bacteria)]|nr:zf-HC2 domain-containing protein [Bacillus sp. (in: firmicutes)]MCM1425557.1 zf-HC2 domain-containing protein [Eubacterium sp.]
MEHNINNCEIIQDLLPLYQDSICSDSSRQMIEEHLSACADCTLFMQKLQNSETEKQLVQEKTSVLTAHSKKEKKRTFTIGICTAAILMIPVIVCLICNLAIGHGLDWFFIVLASLLVTASLSVVPLIMEEHRGLWTLGSFTASLLLLLLTTCIYTHGNWFFLASIPTLFGLSVVFMPYVIHCIPLPEPAAHHKGLLVMLWDTIWLYGVIIVCGFHSSTADYWRVALEITNFCLLLPWILFLIIRYFKSNAFIKAGICTLFAGIFCSVINYVVALVLRDPLNHPMNWILWNNAAYDILITTIPLGIIFLIIGYCKKKRDAR